MKSLHEIFADINKELNFAQKHFPPFHSVHEGYAIILEEMDELWSLIKDNKIHTIDNMHHEALQVATMAIRFILDCQKSINNKMTEL